MRVYTGRGEHRVNNLVQRKGTACPPRLRDFTQRPGPTQVEFTLHPLQETVAAEHTPCLGDSGGILDSAHQSLLDIQPVALHPFPSIRAKPLQHVLRLQPFGGLRQSRQRREARPPELRQHGRWCQVCFVGVFCPLSCKQL